MIWAASAVFLMSVVSGGLALVSLLSIGGGVKMNNLINSTEDQIELLEIGIKNAREDVKECQENLEFSRQKFDDYVLQNQNSNVRANDHIENLESQLLPYMDAVEERDEAIEKLREQITVLEEQVILYQRNIDQLKSNQENIFE